MTGVPRGAVDYAHMNTEEDTELTAALNLIASQTLPAGYVVPPPSDVASFGRQEVAVEPSMAWLQPTVASVPP